MDMFHDDFTIVKCSTIHQTTLTLNGQPIDVIKNESGIFAHRIKRERSDAKLQFTNSYLYDDQPANFIGN